MKIEQNIPLAPFTSLRVGGPAQYFARVANEAELLEAIAFAREKNLPTFVLGGGTNVLFLDSGFAGLVIKNELTTIDWDAPRVTIGSGCPLGKVVAESVKHRLDGLTELAGLPGSVGGAVAGNAGSYGREIGELVFHGRVLTSTGVRAVDHTWFGFEYRTSRLKHSGDILLSVTLHLQPTTIDLQTKLWQTARTRAAKEPGGYNAGSWWKNPSGGRKAWELIDGANLRGMCVGGACVSDKHANYLINTGAATAQDFIALTERVEQAVLAIHGVRLEREVQIVG